MIFRKAEFKDIDRIMEIYEVARQFMVDTGNPNQWIDGYPRRKLIEDDVTKGHFYVSEGKEDGQLHGAFAFILGNDPTYEVIEDGAWLNDEPYGTIHRMANDCTIKGLLEKSLPFCFGMTDNVRIDTHADNIPMQGAIAKQGFTRCGIIYVDDGSARIAYQLKNK